MNENITLPEKVAELSGALDIQRINYVGHSVPRSTGSAAHGHTMATSFILKGIAAPLLCVRKLPTP
jgi:hypothetical protein